MFPTRTRKPAAAAVSALAKAIELDPRYRDKAKSDADYDPIRADPAFRKLTCGEWRHLRHLRCSFAERRDPEAWLRQLKALPLKQTLPP